MALKTLTITTVSLALATVIDVWAQEAKPADKPAAKVTYDEHVRTVFRDHCFNCHSQGRAKSDLELDTYAATMRGGAGGEVVLAGDLESSRLYGLVAHLEEPKMPPEQDKLPEAKLAIIKNWILGGALENSGSTVKPSNKPKLDLSASAGFKRPEGPPPMPQALSKRPVVHTAHSGAVTALAASPWAPLVAVAGQKQILLYHSDSGELLGVLPFEEGVPHVLKFSRSGALLLAGGGHGAHRGTVVVYEVKTGQRVFQVGDELDVVLAADINENHTMIALGGPGRTVRIFATADGSLQHEIRKHTDWVTSLEFSPDGVLLATADRNGGMFVWEADTAREYQSLKGHTACITDVSWRADSNILASSSEDGTVKLWEMNGGTSVKSWNAHRGGAASVKFAHDGKLASAGRDKLTKVWDQNGQQVKAFEALPDLALEVAITHDGSRVVAGDWTGELRVWNVADGKALARLSNNPPTLEMLAKAEADKALAAKAEADRLAAELAALQKAFDAKAAAIQKASNAVAAAKAAADKATAESVAATKLATEKIAAAKAAADTAAAEATQAAKSEQERSEAEKVLAQKAAIAKAAADKAAAAKAAAQTAATEKSAAEKRAADQAAAAKAAAEKLADDTAASQKAAQEKAAAEKALAEKAALSKTAAEAAAKATTAAKAAADQAAADKSTAQASAAN
jgi:WD40 repeat protein